MIVAVKILLALVGFGLGFWAVRQVFGRATRNAKYFGLYLSVSVFILALSVVVDASFHRIGPGGRGDPLIYWALWGGLIGIFGSGLVLVIGRYFEARSSSE